MYSLIIKKLYKRKQISKEICVVYFKNMFTQSDGLYVNYFCSNLDIYFIL